jgi:hypothetical protein
MTIDDMGNESTNDSQTETECVFDAATTRDTEPGQQETLHRPGL